MTANRAATAMDDLVPMLMSGDVPKSIAFYRDVLGFDVIDRMDDVGKTGWASLANGPVRLMLASPTYVPRAPLIEGRHPQSVYYFYPADVEALHRTVCSVPYPATELVVRFYGLKEFEVVDPDGHVLVFGQHTDEPPTPQSSVG